MKQNEKITLSEREMMEDCLQTQKKIAAGYNNCAGECTDDQLRTAFVSILSEEQDVSGKIFDAMSNRGWYQPKTAEQSEVTKIRQKFLSSLN